jgi:protein involved in polysaccharide export with SLBB domain
MTRVVRIVRAAPLLGVGALVCLSLVPHPVVAQQPDPWDFRSRDATRPQLEQALVRYQAAAASTAYSDALRAQAVRDADSIRIRLRDGDMQAGDRVRVTVEGQTRLSDTFAVSAGPTLVLPVVGPISLKGVLRSELEARIAASVDSVYRDVSVHVEPFTTLGALGGVLRPGFYAVKSDAPLQDLIIAAGGLGPTAAFPKTRIMRGRKLLFDADSVLRFMSERRTIASLGLHPGDELTVPVEVPHTTFEVVQTLSYALTLPLSLYTLYQLVK